MYLFLLMNSWQKRNTYQTLCRIIRVHSGRNAIKHKDVDLLQEVTECPKKLQVPFISLKDQWRGLEHMVPQLHKIVFYPTPYLHLIPQISYWSGN